MVDKGLKHQLDKPSLPRASFCSDTNAELCAHAHKIFSVSPKVTADTELPSVFVPKSAELLSSPSPPGSSCGLGLSAAGWRGMEIPSPWGPPQFYQISSQEITLVSGLTSWLLSSCLVYPLGTDATQEHVKTQAGDYSLF